MPSDEFVYNEEKIKKDLKEAVIESWIPYVVIAITALFIGVLFVCDRLSFPVSELFLNVVRAPLVFGFLPNFFCAVSAMRKVKEAHKALYNEADGVYIRGWIAIFLSVAHVILIAIYVVPHWIR